MGKQNKYGPYTLARVRASNLYKQTVGYAGLLGLTKDQYLQALWRDVNISHETVELHHSLITRAVTWYKCYNWDLYVRIADLQDCKLIQLSDEGLSIKLAKFNIGPVTYPTNQALAERNFWRLHESA